MLDFKKQVIDKSFETPVLVDFWAPWCGPCRVLGPVLEQLAEEQAGRWELVKINTEEEQELAMDYGIRSIPNVKLFYGGEVVAEFAGAKPKAQLEQWLDENLPDASAGELQAILSEGDEELQLEKLRQYIQANPENKEARLALAKMLVFKSPGETSGLLADFVEGDTGYDDAADLKTLSQLMQFSTENGAAAGAHLAAARQALSENDLKKAIEKIIEATMADKNYAGDLPRRSAIALFHLWGREHPLTQAYRRRFDMALY